MSVDFAWEEGEGDATGDRRTSNAMSCEISSPAVASVSRLRRARLAGRERAFHYRPLARLGVRVRTKSR